MISPARRRLTACDHSMKFADVTLPLVGGKRFQRRRGESHGVLHARIPQDGPDELGDDVRLLPQRGQLNPFSASRDQLAGLLFQLVRWQDRRQDDGPRETVENSGQ